MLEPRELDSGDQQQRIVAESERRQLGDSEQMRDGGVARRVCDTPRTERRPQLEPDCVRTVTRPALDRRVGEKTGDVPGRPVRLVKLTPASTAEREHT